MAEVNAAAGQSSDREDERLLRRIADGDRAAFAALHQRRHAHVYRFAVGIVKAPDRAEEVTNDTMVAVWSGAARFEFRSKVSTWIFGIAYRTALKSLRRDRFEQSHVDIEVLPEIEDAMIETAENLFNRTRVTKALAALPGELRAVVELTYYQGYSYIEIGKILSCPVGTVKSRMHSARARLREVLE